jgi:hypothetical protein
MKDVANVSPAPLVSTAWGTCVTRHTAQDGGRAGRCAEERRRMLEVVQAQ